MKTLFIPKALGREFTAAEWKTAKSMMVTAVQDFGRPDVSLAVARWAEPHLVPSGPESRPDLDRLYLVHQYLVAAQLLVAAGDRKTKPLSAVEEAVKMLGDDAGLRRTLKKIGPIPERSEGLPDDFITCVFVLTSIADLHVVAEFTAKRETVHGSQGSAAVAIARLIAQIHAPDGKRPTPRQFALADESAAGRRFAYYNHLCLRCVVLRYLHLRAKHSNKKDEPVLEAVRHVIAELVGVVQRNEVARELVAIDPDLQLLREVATDPDFPSNDEERQFLKMINR